MKGGFFLTVAAPPEIPAEEFVQIQLLLTRYAWANDSHDYEAMGLCFTSDATVDSEQTYPGMIDLPVSGRERVVEWIVSAHKLRPGWIRRHVLTNVNILEYGGNTARVRTYYTAVNTPPDAGAVVTHTGYYEDTVVREADGQWKISRRVPHRDGITPTPVVIVTLMTH